MASQPSQPVGVRVGRRRSSISWRLPLLVILALTFVVVATSLVNALFTRRGLEAVQEGSLDNLALIQSTSLERQLSEHVARLEQLAAERNIYQQAAFSNSRYEEEPDPEAALQRDRQSWADAMELDEGAEDTALIRRVSGDFSTQILLAETENVRNIIGVESTLMLTNRYGAVVGASLLPNHFIQAQTTWWQQVNESGETFISQPLTNIGGSTIPFINRIDFALPVRDEDGVLVGVLYSAYDYTAVRDQIRQGRASGSARTALLNGQGEVLFISSLYSELGSATLPLANMLEELVEFPGPAPSEAAFVGKAVPIESDMKAIEALNWHVAAVQRQADLLAPIRNSILPSVLIAVALGFIIVGLLNLAFIWPLSADLRRLQEAAESLEQGQLDTQVNLSRKDELGVLAGAFNRMADRLQAQIRELNDFAYIVSHDLKAPLRGIRNLSDWIGEDLGDDLPEDVSEYLVLLHQRVDRMQDLIDDILVYSRAGRSGVESSEVDVGHLLNEVIDLLQAPADTAIEIAPDMPTLIMPRVHLEQLFTNLIGNALKYGRHDDCRIQIGVERLNGYYRFSVTDNGPGIAPEHHEIIFKMFQTLSTKDQTNSTGVGLAIVKKIVELHGGQVGLQSQLDQGSTFWFTLPADRGDMG